MVGAANATETAALRCRELRAARARKDARRFADLLV